ncbi:MAG: [FeFe] hydrogenase H-cluster radical SAM maturase HydE, partial [Candidatus Omnitrophota bacterium]
MSYVKEQLTAALLEKNKRKTGMLFSDADRCRKERVGDEVYLRGVIEFSNYCRMDCLYCGLRRS